MPSCVWLLLSLETQSLYPMWSGHFQDSLYFLHPTSHFSFFPLEQVDVEGLFTLFISLFGFSRSYHFYGDHPHPIPLIGFPNVSLPKVNSYMPFRYVLVGLFPSFMSFFNLQISVFLSTANKSAFSYIIFLLFKHGSASTYCPHSSSRSSSLLAVYIHSFPFFPPSSVHLDIYYFLMIPANQLVHGRYPHPPMKMFEPII